MRRRTLPLLLLQLLIGMAGEAAAQSPRVVGRVIARRPDVEGKILPRAPESLAPRSAIEHGMWVNTKRRGRARIALGKGERKRGFVELGPRTEVEFVGLILEGKPPATGLWLGYGDLRRVFGEEEEGVQPGEGGYWIQTPSGEVIPLGTDVYVRVDRRDKSTLVAVVEGRALVKSRTGVTVEVGPGEWTHVPIDGPPTPPRPTPPPSDGVWPPFPRELLPVDPPQLRDLRFDLPK